MLKGIALTPIAGVEGSSRLVSAQVAVSLLLLVGSGLVSRSLEAARQTDPGYDASHVTSVSIDVKQSGYDEARGRVFSRRWRRPATFA